MSINEHSAFSTQPEKYWRVVRSVIGSMLMAERCRLFGKHYGLHTGDFEAFAAAHVLAGHQIVLAQHVRAGLGEAGAIALIGASG